MLHSCIPHRHTTVMQLEKYLEIKHYLSCGMGLLRNASYFIFNTSLEIRGADKSEGLPPSPQNTSRHPDSLCEGFSLHAWSWHVGKPSQLEKNKEQTQRSWLYYSIRQCQKRAALLAAGRYSSWHSPLLLLRDVLQCRFFHLCQPRVRCCCPGHLMALSEQCTILAHLHVWWVGFHMG